MATLEDIGVSAGINILTAFVFFVIFAFLRLQPFNDRVYFSKWYLKGLRSSPASGGGVFGGRFLNLDLRSYIKFLHLMPEALKMPERELIDHAGLDSVVYLRIYWLGLKIFAPIAILAWAVLVPVNWTNNELEMAKQLKNVTSSDIDKLSISNIPEYSNRFWTHIVMAYAFTIWTCYMLMKESELVANMRLQFLASEGRRPDQFTVLVRNVPPDPDESVSELVEHFFLVNHPDHYLTHQVVCNANKLADLVSKKKKLQNWLDYYQLKYSRNNSQTRPIAKLGCLGLCGQKVDAIEHYIAEVDKTSKEIAEERENVVNDQKSIMPASFVSFLLGLVYAPVTPMLRPFILIFFWLAYIVYRYQIINVYNQEHESGAAFWPDVHGRVITALIISQLLPMGLLGTKHAALAAPFLIALPVITIGFHRFCKGRYEPAFIRYPLQEAMMKDTLERAREPNLNLKGYLQDAYIIRFSKAVMMMMMVTCSENWRMKSS